MKKEQRKESIIKKKAKSTYEKFIEDDEQKDLLEKEYKELLLWLIAQMSTYYCVNYRVAV